MSNVERVARELAESDGLHKGAPVESLKPWLRHAEIAIAAALPSREEFSETVAWILNDLPKAYVGENAGLDGNKAVGRMIYDALLAYMER